MKSLKAKFALVLLSTLGFFTGTHAQLTPGADAYTSTASPTKNFGAATTLGVENGRFGDATAQKWQYRVRQKNQDMALFLMGERRWALEANRHLPSIPNEG